MPGAPSLLNPGKRSWDMLPALHPPHPHTRCRIDFTPRIDYMLNPRSMLYIPGCGMRRMQPLRVGCLSYGAALGQRRSDFLLVHGALPLAPGVYIRTATPHPHAPPHRSGGAVRLLCIVSVEYPDTVRDGGDIEIRVWRSPALISETESEIEPPTALTLSSVIVYWLGFHPQKSQPNRT